MSEPDRLSGVEDRRAATEQLLARAGVEQQPLGLLFGYELCVMDGPRHVLADERLVQAWLTANEKLKTDLVRETFRRLKEKGRLLGPVEENGSIGEEVVSPELGLVLAARTRPGFAVLAQHHDSTMRTMKMFSVAQGDESARALVVEVPDKALGVDRKGRKIERALGPLGWVYRFILVSPSRAASILANWSIQPNPESFAVVTTLRHRAGEQLTVGRVVVRGDGDRASVLGPNGESSGSRSRSEAELTEMMADLLASAAS